MNTYDDRNAQQQAKSINYTSVLAGVGALVLAILLGFADAAVLSGLRSTGSISEMIVPVRVAALLTIGAALLGIGAVASFLSVFRQSAAAGVEAEGLEPAHEPVVAEEIDVFNVRKAA